MSHDYVQNGNPGWGAIGIMLMFITNVVFIAWFIQGSWKNLWSRGTFYKLVAAAFVQVITLLRYVKTYHIIV